MQASMKHVLNFWLLILGSALVGRIISAPAEGIFIIALLSLIIYFIGILGENRW